MSRKRNPLEAVKEQFSGNWMIRAYLGDLVATGLYGRTLGEVAGRLVSQGIERCIEAGTIKRRAPIAGEPRI